MSPKKASAPKPVAPVKADRLHKFLAATGAVAGVFALAGADPAVDGTNSPTAIVIDFTRRVVLILDTLALFEERRGQRGSLLSAVAG